MLQDLEHLCYEERPEGAGAAQLEQSSLRGMESTHKSLQGGNEEDSRGDSRGAPGQDQRPGAHADT